MKEVSIKVNGMMCNGCENRIQNAISNIEGVEKVNANYESGIVTITLNKEIEESTLTEKIEDLGYEIAKED